MNALTERQRAVLTLAAHGNTNAAIGRRLGGLTADQVKNQMSGALRKLDAPDRTAAAVTAIQLGLITPPFQPGAVWVPAAAVRAVTTRWQGKAPAALLTHLAGLCGDHPTRRPA